LTKALQGLYNCKVGKLVGMAKVKDIDVKKLSIPKREFISALKKVSQQVGKQKSSSK